MSKKVQIIPLMLLTLLLFGCFKPAPVTPPPAPVIPPDNQEDHVEAEKIQISVFFNSETLDPDFTCTKVFPVERMVEKSATVAKAALEELLKGPTEAEEQSQYSTAINSGVTLKSVTIVGGLAKADFDEQLGYQVGGSCRVSAIRAQIEETLKQFPTVTEVQISINGVSGDTILQP